MVPNLGGSINGHAPGVVLRSAAALDDVDYLTMSELHTAMESSLSAVLEDRPANAVSAMCEKLLHWGAINKYATAQVKVPAARSASTGPASPSGQGAMFGDRTFFSAPGSLEGVLSSLEDVAQRREFSTKELEIISRLNTHAAASSAPKIHVAQRFGRKAAYLQPKPEQNAFSQSVSRLSASYSRAALLVDVSDENSEASEKEQRGSDIKSNGALEVLLEACLECSSNQIDHVRLVKTLIQSASKLLEADRCTFFLVEGDELVSKIAEGTSEIRLPVSGGGIASHVAQTGQVVNLNDAYSDDRFNRAIDQKTGYRTMSLLCAPVLYQEEVIAVVQLLNKHAKSKSKTEWGVFESDAVSLFEAFAAFAGVFLANSYHFREIAAEKRKNEVLLNVVQRVNRTDLRKWKDIAGVISAGCTELLQAERCTLYLVDKEAGLLCATTVDGTEITMPLEQGIAGFVCSSGETVNIPDAYCDPRFNPDVDAATGYVTKSILCVPVVADGEVVAVAQVINKYNGEFSERDEELLNFFSAFSGLHLYNAKLLEFCRESGESAMRLLNSQSGVVGAADVPGLEIKLAAESDVLRLLTMELWDGEFAAVLTTEFNVHNYTVKSGNYEKLIPLAIALFEAIGYVDRFKLDKKVLGRFLLTASSKYRAVPYHNFVHAFDVLQSVYLFLEVGKGKERLTDLEGFVLMVSSIIHDIDHMGLNNSFHSKSETPLGLLSNASGASSVLEVHHCNVAISLLGFPEVAVFNTLPTEERVFAYKLLINNVLSTDMAKHGEILSAYKELCSGTYDKGNAEHRRIASAILLKAADLSNLTRPFNISRLWGIAITTEFYLQGDSERAQGKSVTPGFDRTTKTELAQGQIGFIKHVGLPFFTQVVDGVFEGLGWALNQLQSNMLKWESIFHKQESQGG